MSTSSQTQPPPSPTRAAAEIAAVIKPTVSVDTAADLLVNLRNAVRTQALNEVRRALLGTTDGDEIHESSEIPAGEIARILDDLGGAR